MVLPQAAAKEIWKGMGRGWEGDGKRLGRGWEGVWKGFGRRWPEDA